MGKYEIYKDKKGEWRWRYRAANGRILADSAEGYVDKRDAYNGIDAMIHHTATEILEVEE